MRLLYGKQDKLVDRFPDGEFDLIFTDFSRKCSLPPYIGYDSEVHLLSGCRRILKDSGNMVIMAPYRFIDCVVANAITAGFRRENLQNIIVWHKTDVISDGYRAFAQACDEYIIWFVNGSGYYFDYLASKTIVGKKHHNYIDMPPCGYLELLRDEGCDVVDPYQKPAKLMRFLLSVFCKPAGHVFDPFAGAGAMLWACQEGGREYTGIENNKRIFRYAYNDRLKREGERKA